MSGTRVIVLGAGLSGLAAAKVLRDVDCQIFEARGNAGGHASSFTTPEGFVFDEGPHVSFTANERIRDFLARSVGGRYFEYPTYATNYFHGHILKHPVQTNLNGLPPALLTQCIADFVHAQYEDRRPVHTYEDWCYRGLGKAITETFTRPYTRKYWTLELEQLTTDWVSERIYAPSLEEVLNGAMASQTADHYYLSKFRYPESGGFGAYASLLAQDAPVRYNKRAVEIDIEQKAISFADGRTEHFEELVSSIPLPELIRLIAGAPVAVKDAAERLACTSHFIISVGINRPHISDAYWTYYYDEDVPFSRASFPSKYSKGTVPEGHSSVQLEVVHSRFKAIPSKDVLVEQCIAAMLKVGLLHSRDEIVSLDARDLRYANVIFDFDRVPNLGVVQRYLQEKGIQSCGRYGEWAYLWTDQSILSGERAGNAVRSAMGLAPAAFDVEP